jgi:hypothetical protein
LRFVMPVTTASGNVVDGVVDAVVDGVAVGVRDVAVDADGENGAGLVLDDVTGAGARLEQQERSATRPRRVA